MSKRDYYEILGVSKGADAPAIKSAYRKMAMKYHPDRNKEEGAEAKFKEASEAYQVLSDNQKKANYDRFGHQAAGMGGGSGGFGGGFQDVGDIFSSFGDIFGDIFSEGAGGRRPSGRSSGAPRRRKGADLRYNLEITFKEAIECASKTIEFEVEGPCKTCDEKGYPKGHPPAPCHTCSGTGQVTTRQGFFQMSSVCPKCRGQGQVISKPCSSCHGRKRVVVENKLKIQIPKGMDEHTNLRLESEGEPGYNGGPTGDLFINISFKKDSKFRKSGFDLTASLEVSYLEAILGTRIEAATVNGKTTVTIPKGLQPGQGVKAQGQGLYKNASSRGDLIYEVQITIPKKLSSKEQQLLEELNGLGGASSSKSRKKKSLKDFF